MSERDELLALRRMAELEAKAAQTPQPTQRSGTDNFSVKGAAMGYLDPIYGIGQVVPRALSAVTSLGGLAPNPVSRAYDRSADQVDQSYQQTEANYSGGRASPEDFDWGRLTGNVVNPVNYVGSGSAKVLQGAGKAKKLLGLAALGAGYGAMAPVKDTENFASEKGTQIALGAGAGPIAQGVASAFGRTLNPQVNQSTKGLLNEGVKLTPGEIAGGSVKWAEDMASSVPILGSFVRNAKSKSIETLNKAAFNRALTPIGEKLPDSVKMGRDAVAYVEGKLGERYEKIIPKLTGKIDQDFVDDYNNILSMVDADDVMNAPEKAKFANIVNNSVFKRTSANGGITGQAIKDIESELGEKAAVFGKGSIQEQQLSDALREVQTTLRTMLERANPQYATELKSINKGWANFKRVQRAASAVGTDEGLFTPAQLQNAVKALDRSKDKSAFAKGEALMQDLSDPARSIMAQSIPNSGTADRLSAAALYTMLSGGSAINPSVALGLIPATAYVPGGRRIAQALLAERPQAVRQVGKAVNKSGGYAGAVSVPLLDKMRQNKKVNEDR